VKLLILLLMAANLLVWWRWSPQQELPVQPVRESLPMLVRVQELSAAERANLAALPAPGPAPASTDANPPDDVDEGPGLTPLPVVDVPSPQTEEIVASLPDPICFAVTAVSEAEAQQLVTHLGRLGASAAIEYQIIEVPGSLMVYVPPFSSRDDALPHLAAIRQSGIDSFLIQDGDYRNGISVGVFSSDQNARIRQTQLEALGYRTATHRYLIERPQYHVVGLYRSEQGFPEQFRTFYLQDFAAIDLVQKNCIEVASQHNFH
jgi:hypothetical protein